VKNQLTLLLGCGKLTKLLNTAAKLKEDSFEKKKKLLDKEKLMW